MKWLSNVFVNFVVRLVIGIALILLINQYFETNDIEKSVGINPVTMSTVGMLGVPGVCLLYGIVFFSGY